MNGWDYAKGGRRRSAYLTGTTSRTTTPSPTRTRVGDAYHRSVLSATGPEPHLSLGWHDQR